MQGMRRTLMAQNLLRCEARRPRSTRTAGAISSSVRLRDRRTYDVPAHRYQALLPCSTVKVGCRVSGWLWLLPCSTVKRGWLAFHCTLPHLRGVVSNLAVCKLPHTSLSASLLSRADACTAACAVHVVRTIQHPAVTGELGKQKTRTTDCAVARVRGRRKRTLRCSGVVADGSSSTSHTNG